MGNAESTPQPPPSARSISRRERRRDQAPVTTFDEKFDALRIDHAETKPTERIIFPSENSEHVDAAGTEQYVRQLLKDSKNRLGLSALSSSNPAAVLEKPSSVIKDTQFFNLKIPHEGSPVSLPCSQIDARLTPDDRSPTNVRAVVAGSSQHAMFSESPSCRSTTSRALN